MSKGFRGTHRSNGLFFEEMDRHVFGFCSSLLFLGCSNSPLTFFFPLSVDLQEMYPWSYSLHLFPEEITFWISLFRSCILFSAKWAAPKYLTVAYWLLWIKVSQQAASARRVHWPSLVFLNAENKSPLWKESTYVQGRETPLLLELRKPEPKSLHKQTLLPLY